MADILVVDDYSDTANSMALWLRQLGHNVAIARDGYQAIEVARRQRPGYVLLDLGLPGLDGYQVAAALRQEFAASLVIIAVTGFASEVIRRQALAAGCDHCVSKPVEPSVLVPLLSPAGDGPDQASRARPPSETSARGVASPLTVSRQVEIVGELGFNLRAADRFVRLARQFRADVRIACGDRTASGLSVLDLTMLPAARGSKLELAADGPDALEALAALAELVTRGFDDGS